MSASFAENDLQLKAHYESSPHCITITNCSSYQLPHLLHSQHRNTHTLQHNATHRNTLQYSVRTTLTWDLFERAPWLTHITDYITHCVTNTAQHTHCNTLQHTAILDENHSYMGHDSFTNAPQLPHLTDYITHCVLNNFWRVNIHHFLTPLHCHAYVLQCVAVWCSVVQCVAERCSVSLWRVIICVTSHYCNAMHMCCSVALGCSTALQSLWCVKIHPIFWLTFMCGYARAVEK